MGGRSTVYVNARFLEEPLTGLQRWGREVLRELDGKQLVIEKRGLFGGRKKR